MMDKLKGKVCCNKKNVFLLVSTIIIVLSIVIGFVYINPKMNRDVLFDKNNNVAYKALQELQKESEKTNSVYIYMDRLGDMLDSDNSYIRTRGLWTVSFILKKF